MISLILEFIDYLQAVFIESWQKIFTLFTALGVLLFFFPNLAEKINRDLSLIQTIGGFIFLVSFLLANFSVYHRLNFSIDRADIRMKVTEQYFRSSKQSGRTPFRQMNNSPNGFNQKGLPDWASLYAQVEVTNVGHEQGSLIWKFVRSNTKLPLLFNQSEFNYDFSLSPIIRARHSTHPILFCDFLLTEQDPKTFAKKLRAIKSSKYRMIIRYWTKSIDGESSPRELILQGNFKDFFSEVVEYWDNYGFKDLADLARGS